MENSNLRYKDEFWWFESYDQRPMVSLKQHTFITENGTYVKLEVNPSFRRIFTGNHRSFQSRDCFSILIFSRSGSQVTTSCGAS